MLIEIIPNAKGEIGQFEIDYYMAGNESLAESELLSTCRINERKDVACWQDSHPEKFSWSSPVARLLINVRSLCTAWRVGPDNRLFTNNHCVSTATELKQTEVWFNYQRTTCNGSLATTVKVMGNELLSTYYTLTIPSSRSMISIRSPLWLLRLRQYRACFGNRIYIPNMGLAILKNSLSRAIRMDLAYVRLISHQPMVEALTRTLATSAIPLVALRALRPQHI